MNGDWDNIPYVGDRIRRFCLNQLVVVFRIYFNVG